MADDFLRSVCVCDNDGDGWAVIGYGYSTYILETGMRRKCIYSVPRRGGEAEGRPEITKAGK